MAPASGARRRAKIRWLLAFQALAWMIAGAELRRRPSQPNSHRRSPAYYRRASSGFVRAGRSARSSDRPSGATTAECGPRRSFVVRQGLKGNDAILEIVLGQGRILTTRADLSGPAGKAVIALGDPAVMDFVVLGPRQIRLVGHRLGSTDLSITRRTDRCSTSRCTLSRTSRSSKSDSGLSFPTQPGTQLRQAVTSWWRESAQSCPGLQNYPDCHDARGGDHGAGIIRRRRRGRR